MSPKQARSTRFCDPPYFPDAKETSSETAATVIATVVTHPNTFEKPLFTFPFIMAVFPLMSIMIRRRGGATRPFSTAD